MLVEKFGNIPCQRKLSSTPRQGKHSHTDRSTSNGLLKSVGCRVTQESDQDLSSNDMPMRLQ